MLNSFNVFFSTGLQLTYRPQSSLVLNYGTMAVALVLQLATLLVLLLGKTDLLGEFRDHFRLNATARNFMTSTLLFRLALALLMSCCNEIEEATIVLFFVGVVFFVYFIGELPYRLAYHNYRSGCCQVGGVVVLFSAMYYRSMKSNASDLEVEGIRWPGILLVGSLIVATLVSLAALCYEMYIRYCRNRKIGGNLETVENPNQEGVKELPPPKRAESRFARFGGLTVSDTMPAHGHILTESGLEEIYL